MALLSRTDQDTDALDVAVVHGNALPLNPGTCLPAGHALSRARFCHLRNSECVIVTHDVVPVGIAAYRHAESDVRVVHEFLVDKTLPVSGAARVADALIVALEMLACDEGVHCLMFLIYGEAGMACFDAHGYRQIVADRCGAWLHKRLEDRAWAHQWCGRPC